MLSDPRLELYHDTVVCMCDMCRFTQHLFQRTKTADEIAQAKLTSQLNTLTAQILTLMRDNQRLVQENTAQAQVR